MEVCLQDVNFGLGGLVPALFCHFVISSAYSGSVFDNGCWRTGCEAEKGRQSGREK